MSKRIFTAFVEFDPETQLYTGTVPSITGAHSQGETLDELQTNLREVLELCLEEMAAQGAPLVEDEFAVELSRARWISPRCETSAPKPTRL